MSGFSQGQFLSINFAPLNGSYFLFSCIPCDFLFKLDIWILYFNNSENHLPLFQICSFWIVDTYNYPFVYWLFQTIFMKTVLLFSWGSLMSLLLYLVFQNSLDRDFLENDKTNKQTKTPLPVFADWFSARTLLQHLSRLALSLDVNKGEILGSF